MEGVLRFIAILVFIQTILMLIPPVAVYYVVQSDTGKTVASKANSILDNTNNLMKTTNDKLPSQMKSLRKLSTKVDKMLPQTEKFISNGVKLSNSMNKKMSIMDNVKHILELLDDTPVDAGVIRNLLNMTKMATVLMKKMNYSHIDDAIKHVDIISKQMTHVFGKKNVNLTQHVLMDADSALDKMNKVFSKLA